MDLTIVGFNGRPVERSTGLKAPLVFDRQSDQYGLSMNSELSSWCSEKEIKAHEEQMLVTRLPVEAPYSPNIIALYAHMKFVDPAEYKGVDSSMLVLRPLPDLGPLELHFALESYVAFVELSQARIIMKRWARTLLRFAHEALEEGLFSRAIAEAARARFASPRSSGQTGDRVEAFSLAWVGLSLQKLDAHQLLANAEREGLRDGVLRRGQELLNELPTSGGRPQLGYRDRSSLPRLCLEDVSCSM